MAKKILLVEDDNNLREIYEARLQAEGYTIVSARDGEEALVVAKAEKPDLIIADIMMPKISGFEMLDILRNTEGLKHVKVVMLTALGQSDDQQRANKLGADRYLVKSQVTLEDIVKTAHDLLADEAKAPAPAASAPSAAASDDKLMNDAVNSLIADTEKTTTPEPAPKPTPEPTPTPATKDTPALNQVPVTHQKVIKPLEGKPEKDLNTLLAEEEAKEAAGAAKSNQAAEPAAVEEAAANAKIEDFVAGASSEPTPPPTSTPDQNPKAS